MSSSFPIQFGRYELTERLALGGMAELFLARATGAHGFEKTVVIKCILPHLAKDKQFKEMFISEAKITAQLSHPKIAQTYELGQCDSRLYIAMEYVDGLDVLAILRECAHRRERMPVHIAIYILREMLDALDFAHQKTGPKGGVVHRDISPSNVLVSLRGGVKLVDFGIAHAAVRDHQTQAGALKGKYGYMAPEQITASGVSAQSDLFSVGIVMSEMLMGRRLFAAPNELDVLLMVRDVDLSRFERLGSHIDDDLRDIILQALQKDPKNRFQSAAEFRDLLDEWLFDQRIRVNSKHVADYVAELYGDASERRRVQLDKALVEMGADDGPAPTEDARADRAVSSQDIERPAAVYTDSTDVDDTHDATTEPVPRDRPEPIAVKTEGTGEHPAQPEPDYYPSISAAVAAISPREPDPASRDFDDSAVGSSGSGQRKRKKLPTMQELADTPKPAPPELKDDHGTPDEKGELEEISALSVLYRRTARAESGLLVLMCGGIRKELYFLDGIPEFCSSNVAGELFGAYLVSQEAITGGELDMALAMMPHYGGKLGDTLVGLGLMKPLEVFRHLTQQVREKVIDVCTWEKGQYEWYSGVKNKRDQFRLDIDPYEVLGAGACQLGWPFLQSWLREVEDKRPRSSRGKASPEDFKLGHGLRDLYNQLSGRKTVSELCRRYTSREGQLRFLRHLYLLVQTDLATLADE